MKPEIEVKFLNVDFQTVRARLQELGAVCEQPMRLMRRSIIDYPDRRLQTAKGIWGWIRVRDEADKVTLTYKQVADDNEQTTHEIEVVVSSYEDTVALFQAIGLVVESVQESKRETWRYKDSEIVLDEWPWLKPYIEIEGPSRKSLETIASDLGFDWNDAVSGSTTEAYRREYPGITGDDTIGNIPEMRFGTTLPDWLQQRITA
jgi:adenylate cyclase class 2